MALLVILGLAQAARAQVPSGDNDFTFFETRIRPVLVEHCLSCHSSDAEARNKLKAGLKLDSPAGWLQGGDAGPAIVPGEPDESPLISAIRQDDFVRMPPKGKLPERVIKDFEDWVRAGAPAPSDSKGTTSAAPDRKLADGRHHWSYQAVAAPPLPSVQDQAWCVNSIDRFIRARLEAESLRPAPDADRGTLIRRLHYDLLGRPPGPEQIDAFLSDPSPLAYEQLVDRLLASPQFGERWGRHWLDVVRFAESLTLRGLILKDAWRYRDYVIASFNEDRPYQDFVREQIAGDLLPAGDLEERRRQLIATTFLCLGNTNLEEQDKAQLRMDVVDEQLDTIGKAFLAQTIGCARCHDHKFDPIPTEDYYALAGILRNTKTLEHANVSKWLERPLPADPETEARRLAHDQEVSRLEVALKEARSRQRLAGLGSSAEGGGGAIARAELPGIVVDDLQARRVGEWQSSQFHKTYIDEGYVHDQNAGKGEKTLTFQPDLPVSGKYEVRLAYAPGTNRARSVPVTIFSADGEFNVMVDMRPPPPIEGRFISLGSYVFESNGQGYVLISNVGTEGHVTPDAVQFLPADQTSTSAEPRIAKTTSAETDRVRRLESELKRLKASAPPREMVITVYEEAEIGETQVHIRGNVHTLGATVRRGFLRSVPPLAESVLPTDQSGRVQLAGWLASEENPLTARVLVNRVWLWLFGAGLVRTSDNFGTTGDLPSHPELLDHLARRLVEEDWSIKRLIRQVVLSRTYRQASQGSPDSIARDPENRLLARVSRRRLDAESLRDTMLSVSGRLREEMGGPTMASSLSSDYGYRDTNTRRSVYIPVFRNALPEIFEVFDFADPSLVTGQRNSSTVSPQALYLLNHPFVIEQARAASQRLLADAHDSVEGRVTRAYRLTLGRAPTELELATAQEFIGNATADAESWAMLFQALFASMDFRYLD
jgi:hypothetical protein